MYINNLDLEFLVSLENLLFEYEGSTSQNLHRLLNLNEKLIMQRKNNRLYANEYQKRKSMHMKHIKKMNKHKAKTWKDDAENSKNNAPKDITPKDNMPKDTRQNDKKNYETEWKPFTYLGVPV